MNSKIIRLKKEARALLWPWCALVIAGALPVILANSYTKKLCAISFFFGVPMLAALSMGNEFQQRTFSLWLSQPLSRVRLWGEKISVMLAAALSAGVVSGIGVFYFAWPQVDFTWRMAAIVCVLVATASAPLLTLAARSTLGGFLLISVYLCGVMLLVFQIVESPDVAQPAALPANAIAAISVFGLVYAVLVLWLGARKLARLQLTGASADSDLLMVGPSLMPEVLAKWLRCRPSGVLGNLIRKEIRLLRPLGLSTLLALLYLAFAAMFRLITEFPIRPGHPELALKFAVFVTLGSFFLLAPIFAGLLSLGEERTSGTQSWHMTLPIAPLRQWSIKLAMAMLAGFTSAVLLPLIVVIAVGTVFGSPLLFIDFRELRDWMVLVPLMTFASFWCACAANGTVRASLWVASVPAAIIFARTGGMWLGQELTRTTGTVRDLVVAGFHLSPSTFASITDSARAGVLWLFVPALLLALIQSYRLFRLQPQESALWMLRCVTPLLIVTVLWSFSASAGFVSSTWAPFDETRRALDKLQPGTAKLELAGEDLPVVNELTQRWLRGSKILVTPDKAQSPAYLATIHLAGGLECRLTVARYGGTASSCAPKGR